MSRFTEPITSPSLLKRICGTVGDAEGWRLFVRSYEPMILAWFRRKGLQEADAWDLTQEVLLRFARRAGRFTLDPGRRFRGLLRTMTDAAWRDWSARRRPWHPGLVPPDELGHVEARPDPDGPAAWLEREADAELMELAFGRVRIRVEPRTWEAFRLLALEGRSGDEAAARLGMRRGSAHAARCKVQRLVRLELARLVAQAEA
ncbi:RNA polymerase sigma factor [Tautonia rosea]|uniref:RNA polymerase sigma factor n=1 Tax=Tautonia rosea TaxID=2728037 RepID=UPI001473BE90|nr:sigma-70 family RNA polymerase sigma factor [Tautonia rosea]